VSLSTLDEYVASRKLVRCDFIKCDAEGGELAIIEGGARTLKALQPSVLIELNACTARRAGFDPRQPLVRLSQLAPYRFERIQPDGTRTTLGEPSKVVLAGEDFFDVLCTVERHVEN
jgi:hypothetical protein